MSIKLMDMIGEGGPKDPAEAFVFLWIANCANDAGYAFPGIEYLARRGRQSERNVKRIIKKLQIEGWLMISRKSAGPAKKGNSYQINVPKLRASGDTVSPENSSDVVSPEGKNKPANKGTSRSSGDTGSPENSGDKTSNVQVTSEQVQVTNPSFSGDKSDIAILKNRKEPSEEPSGETTAPPVVALDASPTQCAQAMFERLAIVAPEKTQRLAAEAIRLQAVALCITPQKAMLLVEKVAAAAIARGEIVNAFWFEDSKWKGMPEAADARAAVGVFSGSIPEDELPVFAPEAADTEAGRRMWEGMSKAIKAQIGTQSFETWVRPIKQVGVLDGVLYLELPCDEFEHVPERYEFATFMPGGAGNIIAITKGRAA